MARLLVRSQLLDWMDHTLITASNARQLQCGSSGRPCPKRRKIRFLDDCSTSLSDSGSPSAANVPSGSQNSGTRGVVDSGDLLQVGNICSSFKPQSMNGRNMAPCSANCIGYIDTSSSDAYRHSFYQGLGDRYEQDAPWIANTRNVVSMDEILCRPAENSLSIVDQLKLARNLVAAVLKFHATPWLNQYFCLRNLSFFWRGKELPRCLETLHVDFEFCHRPSLQLEPSMADVDPMREDNLASLLEVTENAKLQYGVRNLALWSLGMLLLQVGRWSTLDAPDDVLSVRKLSSETCALGPRYRELTNKCLGCDFGYGDDLSKPRLQQAVYEGVMCELNNMIGSLDIGSDDVE